MKKRLVSIATFLLIGTLLAGCSCDVIVPACNEDDPCWCDENPHDPNCDDIPDPNFCDLNPDDPLCGDDPFKVSDLVQVYETTGTKSKIMSRQTDLKLEDEEFTGNTQVIVDSSLEFETLDGFGAAMTHSSAYLFNQLTKPQRTEVFEQLFGEEGARFNLVRVPLGTSDYTRSEENFYTLDDTTGSDDFLMSKFTLEKDERYLIPMLKEVLEINPNIEIFMAPWSAPAWMKSNNNLIGGKLKGFENTGLNNPSNYELAYAKYLYTAIEQYAAAGVRISHLSLLNEPYIGNVNYPSMNMDALQYYRVAKEFVNLVNAGNHKYIRITPYDHNVNSVSDVSFETFVDPVYEDSTINPYISGFALHCYGGNWPSAYAGFLENQLDYFAGKKFYITEITETQTSVDFSQNLAWSTNNVSVGPMGYGVAGCMYWNLALDRNGAPVKGNAAKLFGVVTIDNGKITYNPAYYAMAHTSKFANIIDDEKPVRVDSYSTNESNIKCATYKNSNGTYTITASNNDDRSSRKVDFVFDDRMVTYTIQPQSLVTLVFNTKEAGAHTNMQFEYINISTLAYDSYRFDVKPVTATDGLEFYFGKNSQDYSEGSKVNSTNNGDGTYTITTEAYPGDIFFNCKSENVSGGLIISVPRMTPSVSVDTSVPEYVVNTSFGLNTATSWSSFCDPNGKNIYRSAKQVFDSTAEKVNVRNGNDDPIYITSETYVDMDADTAKPYYFFVMYGKGGVTRFVSSPITFKSDVIANGSESLTLITKSNLPILTYKATMLTADFTNARLVLKDNAYERYDTVNLSGTSSVSMELDLSQIEQTGVWYDILFEQGNGASYTVLDSAANTAQTITIGGRIYEFKEWEHILKVNCRNV